MVNRDQPGSSVEVSASWWSRTEHRCVSLRGKRPDRKHHDAVIALIGIDIEKAPEQWHGFGHGALNFSSAVGSDEHDAHGPVGKVWMSSGDLDQFDTQQVGDADCLEYWTPAERIDEFNDQIAGRITVVSEWRP